MDNGKLNGVVATEENLLAEGYRKYTGEEMDIYYNINKCEHAGKCVGGDPAVFEVGRRPWIIPDNGTVDGNIQVVDRCPAQALKYVKK